jgi:hypothetical protein
VVKSLQAAASQKHETRGNPQYESDNQAGHSLAHIVQLGLKYDAFRMNLPQHRALDPIIRLLAEQIRIIIPGNFGDLA